ncbi:hypothetical protein G7Y89_g7940 [Cudoniella acicularis]|uniref:Uncharacterized protein n=1 Tax=Cudoniella acicularis TaxID=354080 RepID=A0A8H4W1I1_9HELO|nr:hypothetical protein G7Y89_g7940 [Cudoniella acicularis]
MMPTKSSHALNRPSHSGRHEEPSKRTNGTSPASPSLKPSLGLLGKPSAKKRLHTSDISATVLSFICFALAVIVVANESISWHLGVRNYQLIVVGLLISIMNLSFGSIAPTLFLLIEARVGVSTLQNYDGIIRNTFLSPGLGFVWRFVLGLMMILPLGLSAAYKSFSGGESAMKIDAVSYVGSNQSYYGIFPPPGLQNFGSASGISLFFNATLPFVVATSAQTNVDPPLPTQPQAYGFNVLMLNNESTAMLDIPQPSYISAIQNLLATGESWNITAPVIATVATFNHSKTENLIAYSLYFASACEAAVESSDAYSVQFMNNGWDLVLLNLPGGNQYLQWIGITANLNTHSASPPECSLFFNSAQLYGITRQMCEGTWSVTRGGIQLVGGFCNGSILPPEKQLIVTDNALFVGGYYMSPLMEFLGAFATTRNESDWAGPYMATGVAAMLWSRISVLELTNADSFNTSLPKQDHPNLPYEDFGVKYLVNDTVLYTRPTLRKSALLYFVFAIQPLLIIIVLGFILVFYSTPLDKDFGLVSILSGINRESLEVLGGAALSGTLVESVKLQINPFQDRNNQKGMIEYYIVPPTTTASKNGKLISKTVYH